MTRETQTEEQSWSVWQDEFAAQNGAAVVVQGADNAPLRVSNNNSICAHLYASAEFAPLCAADCGRAFQTADEAGKIVEVKCHAGLRFLAKPFVVREQKLVAIIGRAFRKTEDYKQATERASGGDWRKFPPDALFSNVLFTGAPPELQSVAAKFDRNLKNSEKQNAENGSQNRRAETDAESVKIKFPETETKAAPAAVIAAEKKQSPLGGNHRNGETGETERRQKIELRRRNREEINRLESWRSIFGSLSKLDYQAACASVLGFVGERYNLTDAAWLERRHDAFEIAAAGKDFGLNDLQLKISADDERLTRAVQNHDSLVFREHSADPRQTARTIQIFPALVGGQIRAALLCGEPSADADLNHRLAKLARAVAPELEVLRLREAARQKELLERAVMKIGDNLRRADDRNFWEFLAQTFTEMLQSERGSLLTFNEATRKFTVRAAVGRNADVIGNLKEELDLRVAHSVLQSGTPLLVADVRLTEIPPASPRRKYRTRSFISYPLIIDDHKIGVFNVTDKADGSEFGQGDLQVLNAFAPQLAITLDRTSLQERAGRLEILSITDSLTGLPNRRYLEERLTEEIRRFERDGSPLSFLMIDVDDFKSYNDRFTHPEGDKALQMVAQALREKLRGADVPARYGGEEFSILLPQTTLPDAAAIAERIREKIARTRFPQRPVTVSIGVAHYTRDLGSYEQLIAAADDALYEAKRAGRNKVKIFQPSYDAAEVVGQRK